LLTAGELVWLLAAVAKGDESAFERLYSATSARLYGLVLRILRRADLANQVLQDTYGRIWQGAGEFDPRIATPMTWMVAIARHQAIDLARNPRALAAAEPALPENLDDAGPIDRQNVTEELRRLLSCLGDLPAERRRLVLLAYYSGWSREQLAAKFAIEAESVRLWLRGSLLQIRECYGS
jgi:RNA polymerase sigma-70 factor (ECF subfamily)